MPPMKRRLRVFALQILLAVTVANAIGLGSASVFAAATEPQIAAEDVGAPGSNRAADHASACSHACHLAYHLVAPVSERPDIAVAPDAHAPPEYSPHPLLALLRKPPFQPPRALA